MKTALTIISTLAFLQISGAQGYDISAELTLKTPGNPAETYILTGDAEGPLKADCDLPVKVTRKITEKGDVTRVVLTVTAKETVYYNIGQKLNTGVH